MDCRVGVADRAVRAAVPKGGSAALPVTVPVSQSVRRMAYPTVIDRAVAPGPGPGQARRQWIIDAQLEQKVRAWSLS